MAFSTAQQGHVPDRKRYVLHRKRGGSDLFRAGYSQVIDSIGKFVQRSWVFGQDPRVSYDQARVEARNLRRATRQGAGISRQAHDFYDQAHDASAEAHAGGGRGRTASRSAGHRRFSPICGALVSRDSHVRPRRSCNVFAMPVSGCELFRQWLHEDPEWGWMGWADCYHFTDTEAKDLGQARRTRQGLP